MFYATKMFLFPRLLQFYLSGGIGEAVASALCDVDFITKQKILAVREIPRSGPPAVLLNMFGISAEKVVDAVLDLIN